MKKYRRIPNSTGIRKNLITGKYNAYKKIDGKQYSRDFDTISEAKRWRHTFNPYQSTYDQEGNGPKFCEMYEKYIKYYTQNLESSSILAKEERIKVFYSQLKNVPIEKISKQLIENILITLKKKASVTGSKRKSFKLPLQELKTFFNWYRENENYRFINPITKSLYKLGIIEKSKSKGNSDIMGLEEFHQFLEAIDDPIYRDFAIVQFNCAGRWNEIAGIQTQNLDLENKTLLIKESIVTGKDRRFLELKPYPKNGEQRTVPIKDDLFLEAVRNRLSEAQNGCSYLFHEDGRPIEYRKVQYRYNKAFKATGLSGKYSSTHALRYCMANAARRFTNSLDSVQAVTGHKSRKLAEHYSRVSSELQETALARVSAEFKAVRERAVQSCSGTVSD